jgi:acyl-CoA synthetase (AMP-forming)/AMP-acid ligase II
MRKLGLRPQDRIGVVSLNSDRYLELYLGLAALFYTSGTTGMIVSGGENIYSTEVEDALASTGPVSTPTSLEARGG